MSIYDVTDGGEKGGKVLSPDRSTYNEEFLKIALDDMTDYYGVDVLFHATLENVLVDKGRIRNVTVGGPFGKKTIFADYFVDATGDALLSVLSGCEFHVGRENDNKCQPMTLCFRMGNVDVKRFFAEDHAAVNELWKKKLAAGELINPREDILAFRTTTDSVLHLNSTRVLKSPVDAFEKSKAEKEGRKQMLELYRFLRDSAPSCRNATLLSSSVEIGVRESRMVKGVYEFTADDIISCRKFDDAGCSRQLRYRHSFARRKRNFALLDPRRRILHHSVPRAAARKHAQSAGCGQMHFVHARSSGVVPHNAHRVLHRRRSGRRDSCRCKSA